MNRMILLGKCPDCGVEDTLSMGRDGEYWKSVKCESCGQAWEDGYELRRAHNLIRVLLESSPHQYVKLCWPQKEEIPCSRFMTQVLNTALMVRFELSPCFATEGGVQGRFRGEPIELTNTDGEIGLCDEHHFHQNKACQEILRWYQDVLELLFIKELVFEGESFGRGAILKLSTEDPVKYGEESFRLLWIALFKKTRKRWFPGKVFTRLASEIPIGKSYLAGLTNGEIVARFVPPPLG